ncbi:MAG: N-acetyl-gamma-glutamyl-phosphate reductase [Clostridia bacterium]|nr:N-acetyl-gamma-glutamyl-phosphate reductase [Clostridia bacterium]
MLNGKTAIKVFIDGSAGTTGLRIYERLAGLDGVETLTLPEELRKDSAARAGAIAEADVAMLCLPDDAAREAAAMADASGTAVIDASTAHRVAPGWAYGFPELSAAHKEAIKTSGRVAVPGCHASGFVALVFPLVEAGVIPADAELSVFSLTGYSGGGKKMIAEYEAAERSPLYGAPRQYALGQTHKHLPEMQAVTGLEKAPVFCPIVADFYSGMEVTVPLFADAINGGADEIKEIYKAKYAGPVVRFSDAPDADGMLSAAAKSGTDGMEVSVFGNGERILLTARFDNLGKGASGAAVQCLNIMRGADETAGLAL